MSICSHNKIKLFNDMPIRFVNVGKGITMQTKPLTYQTTGGYKRLLTEFIAI